MSRRRLPHIYPADRWLFVTWHLHGSLPAGLYPPAEKPSAGTAFVWTDRYLDTTREGPMFLFRADIARLIVDALQRGKAAGWYDLRAYVVMRNHVHVLIRPLRDPSGVLQRLKGATARGANEILGRTGKPFWQHESYDHWVRNDSQLERIVAYIESNPVKAGLASEPCRYRWSSAWKTAN